ncbi:MAG: acyl-CoA dehydrogenase, partial [Sphingobacteriia bacterium 32-37-4]
MEATNKTKALLGGEWIIKESNPHETFIPEEFNEEQTMVMDMCHQFLDAEILPIVDRIDKMEPGLVASLMQKAGEQGLLSTSFPEEYGGLGKDFITSTIVNEGMGGGYSFSVAVAAHTGIGSLPILYFGTEEQKQKYIPKLASGEWKGAYGLTEPNSGSDALGAKTTAKLSEDGKHYLLNGQKCWITNGGFADVFTVFAKIDGDKFTAFIIDRGTEGFTQGPATLGGAKKATDTSVQYAKTREQFKLPIAKFGAIRHKMAEMAIRLWVCESALYRSAKWIDDKEHELAASGKSFAEALLGAAEEYAIECAMLKVYGSEVLDFVVDEGVQIHGGNGFSDEYVISKAYRDSRINRIYEGTNEINRLLTVDMVLKRAMKGKLDLMGPAMSVQKELMSIPDFGAEEEGTYAKELKAIANFKKAILMVAGAAVQKLMMQLDKEQEILMNIADMAIEVFHAESALLRVMKLASLRGDAAVATQNDIMRTYLYDAADRINKAGKDALNSFADGDELRMMHIGLKRFTKVEPFNCKEARR